VSTAAVLLALGAAVMHAAWTLLLARAPDTDAATAAALAIAVVVFAPFAALGWDVEGAAVPYIALSALFEIGFFAMLALALRSGEVGLVYPLSRGVAPVLVLVVGVVALGADVSAAQAAGVGVIAAGVLVARGLGGRASARDTGYALACGACIAGYTLTDSYGLDHAAPVPYLECVLIGVVLVYVPAVARLRGGVRRAATPRVGIAALCIFGAYALVLAALERAPAAPVAALRETSVVFATAFAALFLGEPAGGRRLAGAAVVVAGITVLALA
jgi:drug/metabolite transporter (DMT)-like permease